MPHTLAQVFPLLQTVEDGRLLADRATRAHRIVPDDDGEDERDGEPHRIDTGLPPHDDEERRDEGRVRTRHPSGAEDPLVPVAGFDSFVNDLHQLAQQADNEGDQEGIEAEEGHWQRGLYQMLNLKRTPVG